MAWSMTGWDVTRDGQLQSCVYDPRDYENFACSDFVAFTAGDGEGKNNRISPRYPPPPPPLMKVRISSRYPRQIQHEFNRAISTS